MNAEQLTAIKERAEKATPGPWRSAGLYGVRTQDAEALSIPLRPSDATFIATAREDVPALVVEIERLMYENSALKRSLEYIAPRKNNPDWSIAHNALAVWGRAE